MRTNIVLDDALVAEATQLTGIKTKRDLVHEALRFLIEHKKRKNLFDLEGKITFSKGYNHKKLREERP